MKIIKVHAHEIFNCFGMPTISCELTLEDGTRVSGSAPIAGTASIFQIDALHDLKKKILGYGVTQSVDLIQQKIAPFLLHQEPSVIEFDMQMIELNSMSDGLEMSTNALLAVSIAVGRAQACIEQLELFEFLAYISAAESVTLPLPLFTMLNGGIKADNPLYIQEFLVLPVGSQDFRSACQLAIELFDCLGSLLREQGYPIVYGLGGGYAPDLRDDRHALDILIAAMNKVGGKELFSIGLDVCAAQFYDAESNLYDWYGKTIDSQELISWYMKVIKEYSICFIEDGLSDQDIAGWKQLYAKFGDDIQLIGGSLFSTDIERIRKGAQDSIVNAVTIMPSQIGTVTQTLQAIQTSQELGMGVVISHSSGETNDTFIADLAVGTSAGQIKAGAPRHGQHIAKYNRLLTIEDTLVSSLLEN